MIVVAQSDPKSLILVTADMARSNPPMTTPFVSEFARRLQGQGAALTLPLTWIEQRLAESNLTIEQLIQSGNQQQAADQVSISNSIGSLRFLGAADWRKFVESMSVVEKTLCSDPVAAYSGMDFATRDQYRAYFDDGTPLGSASNSECQIDSISQSWAVISGVGKPQRAQMAMNAVFKRLVRADSGIIQLLDPPFDHSELDPGYIKSYVPGVRENGGQYTHADAALAATAHHAPASQAGRRRHQQGGRTHRRERG